jgi:GT2 family glycosyltransferase
MPDNTSAPAASHGGIRRLEATVVGLRQRLYLEQRRRLELHNTVWWRAAAPLRIFSHILHQMIGKRSKRRSGLPPSKGGGDASATRSRQIFKAEADAGLRKFLAGSSQIVLPSSELPAVSILLVLYNQASFTLRCLRSIASTVQGGAEVIVLDNGSSDETGELLARVTGARVIRSNENLYYLRGVNLGAGYATGRCLLLLNNDTELGSDSVARALGLLEFDPSIGAVGGRLVRPSGLLQEAGGIVWRDGSCFSYGADRGPEIGPCMFQRDVDYVSGAFLMTRRELFERLGRFDEALVPAYYEETDYCLRLWQSGYRVVFDPRVLVHHYEFASGSKDAATALMRRNQAILVDRHRDVLRTRHMPPLPEYPLPARSRDWDRVVGRALVLVQQLPASLGKPDQRRAAAVVRALEGADWFVTVHPLTAEATSWDEVRKSMAWTVEVMLGDDLTSLAHFLRDRAGYYDLAVVIGASTWAALAHDQPCAAALAELGLVYDGHHGSDPSDAPAGGLPPLGSSTTLVLAPSGTVAERWRGHTTLQVGVLGPAPPPDLPPTDPSWRRFSAQLGSLLAPGKAG